MKGSGMAFAMTIAGVFGGTTQAEDNNATVTVRRPTVVQISQCMKRRMSADRVITYNDAMKACRTSPLARQPTASGTLMSAATVRPASDQGAFSDSKQGRTTR